MLTGHTINQEESAQTYELENRGDKILPFELCKCVVVAVDDGVVAVAVVGDADGEDAVAVVVEGLEFETRQS